MVPMEQQGAVPHAESEQDKSVTYKSLSTSQRKSVEKKLGIFIDNLDLKVDAILKQRKMIPVVFGSASVCEVLREKCQGEEAWDFLDCTLLHKNKTKKHAMEESRAAITNAMKKGCTLCVFFGTPSV